VARLGVGFSITYPLNIVYNVFFSSQFHFFVKDVNLLKLLWKNSKQLPLFATHESIPKNGEKREEQKKEREKERRRREGEKGRIAEEGGAEEGEGEKEVREKILGRISWDLL
jgi:hypothetical protein